jgi:hypothetical protein
LNSSSVGILLISGDKHQTPLAHFFISHGIANSGVVFDAGRTGLGEVVVADFVAKVFFSRIDGLAICLFIAVFDATTFVLRKGCDHKKA